MQVPSLSRELVYRLADDLEIDVCRVCLKRCGEEVYIRRQAYKVLLYMVEQRQRLVTKSELHEGLWPNTAVTDNTMVQCIAEIRRVLGDDPRKPRFIRTVPGLGYRYIGSVEMIPESLAAGAESSLMPATASQHRHEARWKEILVLALGGLVFITLSALVVTALASR